MDSEGRSCAHFASRRLVVVQWRLGEWLSLQMMCHAAVYNKNRPRQMRRGRFFIRGEGRQSADGRTLPSLMRFSMTVCAMAFGTASYCLKIIVNEPRPCVTVRIALE